MTTIRTGSRLHFGLFDLRYFGGVGMMIEEPAVEATARKDAQWTIGGSCRPRTQFVIDRLTSRYPDLSPMHIDIKSAPPEHAGFGAGTQVTMSVAAAITAETGRTQMTLELASLLDRGKRSAIGVHGFEHGGLLLDAGKIGDKGCPAPAARIELPTHWSVLLITPKGAPMWSGSRERDAFELLGRQKSNNEEDGLQRFVESELFPAARRGHLSAFGAALTEFNARSGQLFASVQGGPYVSPEVARIVDELRLLGLTGVGQSSWGPTVFAFDVDEEKLTRVGGLFSDRAQVRITKPRNRGAIRI